MSCWWWTSIATHLVRQLWRKENIAASPILRDHWTPPGKQQHYHWPIWKEATSSLRANRCLASWDGPGVRWMIHQGSSKPTGGHAHAHMMLACKMVCPYVSAATATGEYRAYSVRWLFFGTIDVSNEPVKMCDRNRFDWPVNLFPHAVFVTVQVPHW